MEMYGTALKRIKEFLGISYRSMYLNFYIKYDFEHLKKGIKKNHKNIFHIQLLGNYRF